MRNESFGRRTLARPRATGAALPALLAAALAGACASPPTSRGSGSEGLSVRSPRLDTPLTETFPPPSAPADPVKRAVFDRVNADRAAAGLGPVEWDERAAQVADAFCARQVEERTRGHYLTDGIPPYARTAFAGVFGVQSENSASWVTTASKFDQPPLHLALTAEREMLAEKPPRDGHRRTILDPDATHVGVGYALRAGRFQMAQEFLVRSLERLTLSAADARLSAVRFEGKTLESRRLEFVMVAREPEPRPLTREEATARASYSYPPADIAYLPEGAVFSRIEGVINEPRLRLRSGGERFAFVFEPQNPGLYTLVFYVSRGAELARPGGSATLWVESAGA